MTYLAVLISFLNVYLIARFARKMFGTTLAASVIISAFAIAIYLKLAFSFDIDLISNKYYWGGVLAVALLIFLFATPLRYFVTWLIVMSIIILCIYMPLGITASKVSMLIALVASIGIVVVTRKHVKLILVGIMSGSNLATGLAILLYALLPVSMYGNLTLMMIPIAILSVALGIFFQFKLYDKYFPAPENAMA